MQDHLDSTGYRRKALAWAEAALADLDLGEC